MYYPTNKDIEIINIILNNNNSIKNIYKELTLLDINGQTDSKAYHKKIKELKKIIKIEDEFYMQHQEYFQYLYSFLVDLDQSINNIEVMLLTGDVDLAKLRLFNKVSCLISKVSEENSENIKEIKRKIEICNRFNSLNLKILQKDINKEKNNKIKNNLNIIKYNNIFAFAQIEHDLLKNEFDISKLPSKIKNIENDSYSLDLIASSYNYYSDILLEYSNENFNNPEILAIVKFILTHIKASFKLFSKEVLEQLSLAFEKIKDSNNEFYNENKKVLNILEKNINKAKKKTKK